MKNNLIEARKALNLVVGFIAPKYRPKVKYCKSDMYGDARVNLADTIEIYRTDDIEIPDLREGKKLVDGFVVVALVNNPGYFDYRAGVGEPPSTDEMEIGKTRSAVEAAKMALRAYFGDMVEGKIQSYYEAKEWEEEEKQREQWAKENGEPI